jgi:methionine-rich copper-binding protein CopC
VPTSLGVSSDLKTVFLSPNAPLAAGATLSVSASGADDLAGNMDSTSASSTFQVGYSGGSVATISGASPPPGSTGVPINASIQVQSSTNLYLISGIVATLAQNGNPLYASLSIAGDGRTVTVITAQPLAASSLIDVTIAGITSIPYHFSFTTGSDLDVVSPVALVWPTNGLSPAPESIVVAIRSNEPLNPLTVNTSSVTLRAPNNAYIDSAVALDNTGSVITLTPNLPLADGGQYTASWTAADLAGNQASGSTSFTVGPWDKTAAALVGIDPPNGATEVSASPAVQAFFTKPVNLTLGAGSFQLLLNGAPVLGSVTVAGSQVSFTPARQLVGGATYSIALTGAVDAFGNAIPGTTSTFTVYASGDTVTGLRWLSSIPANGAVGVPADAPVTLAFNEPVTTSSALSIGAGVGYQVYNTYLSTQVQGNSVVIQPTVPFSGGSQVSVGGTVRDSTGNSAYISLSFSVAPVAAATPPVLEYTFPAAGSTIPATGTNLVLRFSEPVIVGQNAIRLIGGPGISTPSWYLEADGRTVVSADPPNLTPDSDITIAVTSNLTDFTGNPIVPVSYVLHTLSAAQSSMPQVQSITPPAGAINVAVDAVIQLQFTHAMDPVSVGNGLHVTANGIPLTGLTGASADGYSFMFTPDLPFGMGALVEVVIGQPADDVTGQEIGAFNSSFTVVQNPAAGYPVPNALSASSTAIDVRFDRPLNPSFPAPYLRAGFERIPSHWELRAGDWLRIVPDALLDPRLQYRIVLDAHTEFPLRLAGSNDPAIESVAYDGITVRIRFDQEINPLTVTPGTLQLIGPDGVPVTYFPGVAVDGLELVLWPATAEPELFAILDGLESAGGAPIRRQEYRLARRSR